MRRHELKSWTDYYGPLEDGSKPFDVRRNDRDYRVGDVIDYREWDPPAALSDAPGYYTGRACRRRVTYVLKGLGPAAVEPLRGVHHEFVVLGLSASKACPARVATDPPQDCGWPFCGCDETADKVLQAIQEADAVIVPRGPLARVIEAAEAHAQPGAMPSVDSALVADAERLKEAMK